MNLLTGEIAEIFIEGGTTTASVSVHGVLVRVSLIFLPEAHIGDTILIESGVAISRIESEALKED